jgi:hypothetical protein
VISSNTLRTVSVRKIANTSLFAVVLCSHSVHIIVLELGGKSEKAGTKFIRIIDSPVFWPEAHDSLHLIL